MAIQDIKTAQEECRLCFERWQREMEASVATALESDE